MINDCKHHRDEGHFGEEAGCSLDHGLWQGLAELCGGHTTVFVWEERGGGGQTKGTRPHKP